MNDEQKLRDLKADVVPELQGRDDIYAGYRRVLADTDAMRFILMPTRVFISTRTTISRRARLLGITMKGFTVNGMRRAI